MCVKSNFVTSLQLCPHACLPKHSAMHVRTYIDARYYCCRANHHAAPQKYVRTRSPLPLPPLPPVRGPTPRFPPHPPLPSKYVHGTTPWYSSETASRSTTRTATGTNTTTSILHPFISTPRFHRGRDRVREYNNEKRCVHKHRNEYPPSAIPSVAPSVLSPSLHKVSTRKVTHGSALGEHNCKATRFFGLLKRPMVSCFLNL